jgi:hypothetical protein
VSLTGKQQLNARLRAIKQSFKPIGKAWADGDVRQNRADVPVRTGRLKASFRVRNATQRKATVYGHFTANFVDAGTKEHAETAHKRAMKFAVGGQTMFSPRVMHRGSKAQRFKRRAAERALEQNPMAIEVIKQWNNAA